MTTASEIKNSLDSNHRSWEALLEESNDISLDTHEDYENETSTFYFLDGSAASFLGYSQDIIADNSNF